VTKIRARSTSALQFNNKRQIRRSSRKLKQAVTIFASIVVLGAILLLASVIAEEREAAEERAWNDVYNLSGAFEDQVHRVIDSLRGAMSLLKPRLTAEGAAFDLVSWIWQAPEFGAATVQVAFVGPDGRLVSSSLELNPNPVDLSDREHIRVHMAGRRDIFIGRPVVGRVSGKVTIQVSDRVEKSDGRFAGVIVFSLSPEFLTSLHRSVRLGSGGLIILAGLDGVIRACFGSSEAAGQEAIGKTIKQMAFFEMTHAKAGGDFVDKNPLNGKRTLFHWRRAGVYPLVVIVGLGKAEVLASANRSAALLALLGAPVIALSAGTAAVLNREITRRVRREIALFVESRKVLRANSELRRRHGQLLETSAELQAERARLERANKALSEAKEIAESANQAKSSLLMNMSHEFRTPMHAILNYTSMGLKKLETKEFDKLNKYLSNIQASGVRLLGMLNALLDLAKLESGRLEITMSRGNLAQVARQAQIELGSLLETKQLELKIDCLTLDTGAVFDSQRVMQVFVNLLSNAIKFSPNCGVIRIVIAEDERIVIAEDEASLEPALKCSVEDHGPGIREADIEKIFEKFAQGSGKIECAGGSGLGLAICREIILLHGGKIWAGHRPGGGAVFHFILPRRRGLKAMETFPIEEHPQKQFLAKAID